MDFAQITVFLSQFVIILKNLIVYALIGRVLLSWFTMGGRSTGKFGQFLNEVTEPFLSVARKIPHTIAMIDLSPMIAIFGIDLLGEVLAKIILNLA